MVDRQLITVDGIPIGYIEAGRADEVDVAPLAPSGSNSPRMASLETGVPSGNSSPGNDGVDPGAGTAHHPRHRDSYGPTFRGERHGTDRHPIGPGPREREREAHERAEPHRRTLGGPHRHSDVGRHLDPTKRERVSDSSKPQHFGLSDVHQAVAPTSINRERFRQELANNPALRDKILRIAANEQGNNPQGTQAVIESMMNRAEVRGTSLEAQARWHRSENGYYQEGSMGRGALENPGQREILEHGLSEALAGSNISNYATDNSSGELAERERSSGAFRLRSQYGGESFFAPGTAEPGLARAYDRWQPNAASTKPVGVTHLAPAKGEPTFASTAGATRMPSGAMLAATGKPPEAFIMHHTGGRGTPKDVLNTLNQRGLGVEYIMDREGNIIPSSGPGAANILPGWGKGAGLNNSNIVGMEVIAKDDKDVTTAQVEAAQRFIRQNYPNTPVFGHGEVNPGHKEADEGMKITNAIRRERESATANK